MSRPRSARRKHQNECLNEVPDTSAQANSGAIVGASLLAALLAIPLCLGCGGPSAPGDVILITLDTTRVDRLGAYGYRHDTTPFLDALAAESVRYERAWSTSSWTLPSHASMLTGKLPGRHSADFYSHGARSELAEVLRGVDDSFPVNSLPEGETTLAEILWVNGFATGAFVAGPWMTQPFGLLQGYGHRDANVTAYGGRRGRAITDAAIAWIRSTPREQPLHVLANYFDPHQPYAPPADFERTKTSTHRVQTHYDDEIRYMDAQIGRLLAALREVGRFDDALIIVVADHGELFGEHDLVSHGYFLYEELIRVPLLVRYAGGQRAGEVSTESLSVVDLLPMICEALGIAVPEGLDGVPVGTRELVIAEFHRNPAVETVSDQPVDRSLTAAIDWPWKLIVGDNGSEELYRLDEDPGEQVQRIGQQTAREVEMKLKQAVAAVRSASAQERSDLSPAVTSPELRERLRALGYID